MGHEHAISFDEIGQGSRLFIGNLAAAKAADQLGWGAVICCAPDHHVACGRTPTMVFDVARLESSPEGLVLLKELLSFASEHLNSGRGIMMHCLAGRHRAASSMAILLLISSKMPAWEAIRCVERHRMEANIYGKLRRTVNSVAELSRPL